MTQFLPARAAPRAIALLRGINVGGHKKVPMAELKALFEDLGLARVRTYIQSGNVVFDGDVARRDLEAAIARTFGFPVDVALRTAVELEATAAENPFPDAAPNRLHVVFPVGEPDGDVALRVAAVRTDGEQLALRGRELYVHYVNGAGRSKVSPAVLDRALGGPCTARNWNTVQKLLELAR